jgi:hypothetical protein
MVAFIEETPWFGWHSDALYVNLKKNPMKIIVEDASAPYNVVAENDPFSNILSV